MDESSAAAQLDVKVEMAPTAVAGSPAEESSQNHHRPRCRCPSRCGGFCTFFIVATIFVPVFIFLISLLFALPLWGVECSHDDLCSYYEWFKYIIGNMVGLATPVTDYSPTSGHAFGEMFDLLIATWSMSLAGLIYGVMAALAFAAATTAHLDAGLTRVFDTLFGLGAEMKKAISGPGSMTIDAFLEDCSETGISQAELRRIFTLSDPDGSGTIDDAEARRLRAYVTEMVETNERMERNRDPRVDALVDELAGLKVAVQSIQKTLETLAQAGELQSRSGHVEVVATL